MSELIADNKKIAKNTIYLYIRMFITMAIGLLTARVVFNALGVSDYGLYNAVGGAVSMFVFLKTSLAQGTQRFLMYSLGTGDIEQSKKVFSTSLFLHMVFAVAIFIFTEIVGLYLLQYKMTIDEGRMGAAMAVFQVSLIETIMGIVISPFCGCIIAHEKMGFIAYTSMLDVVFKLLIVYLLLVVDNVDKLIMYSLFYLVASQISNIAYFIYCRMKFEETHFSFQYVDASLRKKIMSFFGWGIIGNVANMGSAQGFTILLNIFYNTTVNAARGIAGTVSGHINSFVSNFQMASAPQIVKLYAAGNTSGMYRLANDTSLYSAFLFMFIAIPIFLEIDYILYIWLGIVPEYTSYFARITIIQSLITCLSNPHVSAIQATGHVKWLQILVGGVLLLIVPTSYILLKMHISLEIIYAVNVLPWAIAIIIRLEILRHYVHIDPSIAYRDVFLKVVCILMLCFIPPFVMHHYMDYGLFRLIVVGSFSLLWSGNIIFWIGLPKNVRKMLVSKVVEKFYKKD